MKALIRSSVLTLFALLLTSSVFAQFTNQVQYTRDIGQAGINVFEAPKTTDVAFDGLKLQIGGDFAIQMQGITQSNAAGDLIELSNNLNLPTANLNLDVQLQEGMRMHMRTYLSSRHHAEAWVKGGYLQLDDLGFIADGFLDNVMQYTRFRVGMDEVNYGDAHFRRSDNAQGIYNPFVENYIMDSFTTEPFAEVTVQNNGFLVVAGLTNGRLNQSPTPGDDGYSVYGKLGVDRELSDDLRVRLTGSVYHSSNESTRDYLYGGDRSGARYYGILESPNDSRVSDFLPRFNPGFPCLTAFQLNPFVQYQGLEFFGIVERAASGDDAVGGAYTQLGGELLYRFGPTNNLYLGGRYNFVTGTATEDSATQEITRVNIGGGWFLTNNVLTKLEYVTSSYDGEGFTGKFAGAAYDGLVIEALISF